MYHLLVVDDESIITDGLYDFFAYGCDLELMVMKAYSSTEALHAARTVRIDILLSDIAMPRMNGLELHREVTALWPQCKTIFLTGYSDFEYIQTAMRGNAVDYILKSESDEVVFDAVSRTIERLESEKAEKYAAEKAEHDRALAAPLLRARFLRGLLEGIDAADGLRGRFRELALPFDETAPALMLMASVDFWPQEYSGSARSREMDSVGGIVERHLAAQAELASVEVSDTTLLWLLQPKAGPDGTRPGCGKLAVYVQGMMGAMQAFCREALGLSVSFATHGAPVDWSDLSAGYGALARSMAKPFAFGGELLLVDERQYPGGEGGARCGDAARENEIRRELKKTELLSALLESGNRDEFTGQFLSMMRAIGLKQPISSSLGMEVTFTISLMFLSCLGKSRLREKVERRVRLDQIVKLGGHMPWEKVTEYYLGLADAIFDSNLDESSSRIDKIVSAVKNHTERHISEDLTLITFADLLHFHPVYLSRLFRQATGMSISGYVLGAKMQRAREMLRQEDLRINEISAGLGFANSSYFAKVFKKYAKLNPQDYRDSLKP